MAHGSSARIQQAPPSHSTRARREIPTILRYLDVFVPDKEFIDRILPDLHGDEPTTFIRYAKFEEACLKLMDSHEFEPDGEEVLLAAFKVRHALRVCARLA